jgi:hypothetical protein
MSHANTHVIYPQSSDRDPVRWQVREDDEDYVKSELGTAILKLIDLITDRLDRADTLTYLMQTAENPPEHATRITAMLLQDLIQEAQEANEKLWELVRPLLKQQDGDEPTRH